MRSKRMFALCLSFTLLLMTVLPALTISAAGNPRSMNLFPTGPRGDLLDELSKRPSNAELFIPFLWQEYELAWNNADKIAFDPSPDEEVIQQAFEQLKSRREALILKSSVFKGSVLSAGTKKPCLSDARTVLQVAVNKLTLTDDLLYYLADVNGDNEITVQDARLILQMVVGNIDTGDSLIKSALFNSAEEVENMTDKQLLELATRIYRLDIPGFYAWEDLGVPFAENECWCGSLPTSASSVTEAINKIEEFFIANSAARHTIKYLGENKYYYLFRITSPGTNPNTYSFRYLVYKDSVKCYSYNSDTGKDDVKFNALDKQSVLELLDLEVSLSYVLWYSQVVYRDFEETDNEYIYTLYMIGGSGGDYGMIGSVTLEKTVIRIDKHTGRYITSWGYQSTKKLKEVTIPGTYRPNPSDFYRIL